MSQQSRHVTTLTRSKPVLASDGGTIQQLTADDFGILRRLSIKRIVLEPGAIREPQWNVNANQLAIVVSGRVLVSTLGNADSFSSFVVEAGQMYHVESGAIYHIENVGDEAAVVIAALRTGHPRHFSLQDSFSAMTDAVLGNTYDLPASAFAAFDRAGSSQISRRTGAADIPSTAGLPNARLFDMVGQVAPLSYPYGSANLARKQFWAALEDISMYRLRIADTGMREPHWHPVTAEMGFVAAGNARMTILDPDGSLDTYLLEAGDVYFVPRAYPHHIENIGGGSLDFLIFFDQPTPGDVGYRATASAFSREVLSTAFEVPERDLPQFPLTPVDPLIVARPNPVDPVG
jgi:oxalate decarboxylase